MVWRRKQSRYSWGTAVENELRKLLTPYLPVNCRSSRSGGLFDVWALGERYIYLFQVKRGEQSLATIHRLLVSLYKGTPLLYNAEIFVAVKQLRKPWLFYTFEKVYRIYKITNKLNGKSYIGLTGLRDIHHRWNIHIKNYHGTRIGRAIRKYGVDNFVFEVIDVTSSLDRANILEKRYIREFGTMVPMGYNMTAGGEGVEISASSRIRGVETRRMNSPDSWKEAAATNIRNDPKFYSKIGTHKVRTPTLKVRADGSYYVGRS